MLTAKRVGNCCASICFFFCWQNRRRYRTEMELLLGLIQSKADGEGRGVKSVGGEEEGWRRGGDLDGERGWLMREERRMEGGGNVGRWRRGGWRAGMRNGVEEEVEEG